MKAHIDYFKILEALGDGVLCLNVKDNVEYINAKALEILESNNSCSEQVHVKEVFDVRTDEKGSIIIQILDEVRKSGKTKGLEKDSYICTYHHQKRYISASISKIEMHFDEYIVINFREITRLIELEHANLEQRMNLESVFNSMPIGLVIVNHERRVIQINTFLQQQFELNELQELPQLIGEILRCSNAKDSICGQGTLCADCQIKNNIKKIQNGKQEIRMIKLKLSHVMDEKEFCRDYQFSFVKTYKEQEPQTLIMLQDITDQISYESQIKEAKEKAEEANRLKTEFLSNISHEIRTPLNGIIGMIDLTRRKLSQEELIENLEAAMSSSLSLLELINNVLDISKMEAGRFLLYNKSFDIAALIEEIEKEYSGKTEEKGLQFNIRKWTHKQTNLIGDRKRLKQVLSDLIDNAIKFTEVGSVRLDYRITSEECKHMNIEFHIIDTGIGIDEAYQRNMFDSFTQADGSFTRNTGGAGLGLAITKRIIDMFGEKLEYVTEKNKGSNFCFSVSLPCDDGVHQGTDKSTNRILINRERKEAIKKKDFLSVSEATPMLCDVINLTGTTVFHNDVVDNTQLEFFTDLNNILKNMVEYCQNNQAEEIEKKAHSLVQYFEKAQLNNLKLLAFRLELDARKGSTKNAPQIISSIINELKIIIVSYD